MPSVCVSGWCGSLIVILVPEKRTANIRRFYRGWYIVAIPDPGVVYFQCTWYRCDREQSRWLLMNSWSWKKKKTLCFNLSKIPYNAIFVPYFLNCVPEIVSGVLLYHFYGLYLLFLFILCPVGWSCRIHGMPLCRGVRLPPTSVLDMTLNNLMVRFQQCWSFGECGVRLHCHCSQVHSGPEW